MSRSWGSCKRASLSACAGKAEEEGGPPLLIGSEAVDDDNAASARDERGAACDLQDLLISGSRVAG